MALTVWTWMPSDNESGAVQVFVLQMSGPSKPLIKAFPAISSTEILQSFVVPAMSPSNKLSRVTLVEPDVQPQPGGVGLAPVQSRETIIATCPAIAGMTCVFRSVTDSAPPTVAVMPVAVIAVALARAFRRLNVIG